MADDCGSRNTLQKTFDGAREKRVVICQQDCRGRARVDAHRIHRGAAVAGRAASGNTCDRQVNT